MAVSKAEKAKFTREITRLRSEESLTYLEAVVRYCELNSIDLRKPNQITKLINDYMRRKIAAEAKDLNLIKKTKTSKK